MFVAPGAFAGLAKLSTLTLERCNLSTVPASSPGPPSSTGGPKAPRTGHREAARGAKVGWLGQLRELRSATGWALEALEPEPGRAQSQHPGHHPLQPELGALPSTAPPELPQGLDLSRNPISAIPARRLSSLVRLQEPDSRVPALTPSRPRLPWLNGLPPPGCGRQRLFRHWRKQPSFSRQTGHPEAVR